MRVFCAALIASPFLINVGAVGNVSAQGPLLVDWNRKAEQLASIEEVYLHVNECPQNVVILETGPGIYRMRAMPRGENGFAHEKKITFVRTLPHWERSQRASETVTVYTLIKEKHRYVGAFVYFANENGNIQMQVEKFSAK